MVVATDGHTLFDAARPAYHPVHYLDSGAARTDAVCYVFLPPIRLPVAGSASVPEERRLHFICSFTIWGSSVAGTLGDTFWAGSGWSGVSAFIAVMLAAALLLANQLRKIPVLVKKVR
ncbi:hypothetical protein SY86_19435 [Erwinia tracheiphila]|uniref:MFS transporter n=1 Tax=Erwinia tracheiphila TaxID=65700 RepID=A0A0M2KIN5_9GAMM|nr:major facilitator superfamily protein [Erwinia tracheiphila PSU-1]KKF37098.1 hypothetical protein SY86_19435 [Erwinia tracheiphila]